MFPQDQPPAIAHSLAFLQAFKLMLLQHQCSLNSAQAVRPHDPKDINTVFFPKYPEMYEAFRGWVMIVIFFSKHLFHP